MSATIDGWAILELMGHRKLGGFVSEVQVAGAGFVRVDIPAVGDIAASTQFYSPSSVYAITPVSEEVARGFAEMSRFQPVGRWELPERLQQPVQAIDYTPVHNRIEEDGEDELDFDDPEEECGEDFLRERDRCD